MRVPRVRESIEWYGDRALRKSRAALTLSTASSGRPLPTSTGIERRGYLSGRSSVRRRRRGPSRRLDGPLDNERISNLLRFNPFVRYHYAPLSVTPTRDFSRRNIKHSPSRDVSASLTKQSSLISLSLFVSSPNLITPRSF